MQSKLKVKKMMLLSKVKLERISKKGTLGKNFTRKNLNNAFISC